jgi:protein-S-isoprenylcysteine O-methyltransferase Ste14
MRTIYTVAAYWSWVVLFLVWLPGYFLRKPAVRRPHRGRQLATTALLIGGYFLLLSQRRFATIGPLAAQITPRVPLLGQIGLAVDLVGVSLAVWARLTLGTNWSGIGTVQRGHELVQWGPYAVIRHPIYAGLLAAMIGTALTIGRLEAYLGAGCGLAAILIRVSDEDALMAEEFPAAHQAYRARTKALIPFVW